MKMNQENVSGKVVESHDYTHSVKHRVNWSHVLATIVLVYAIAQLGPAVAKAAENRSEEE